MTWRSKKLSIWRACWGGSPTKDTEEPQPVVSLQSMIHAASSRRVTGTGTPASYILSSPRHLSNDSEPPRSGSNSCCPSPRTSSPGFADGTPSRSGTPRSDSRRQPSLLNRRDPFANIDKKLCIDIPSSPTSPLQSQRSSSSRFMMCSTPTSPLQGSASSKYIRSAPTSPLQSHGSSSARYPRTMHLRSSSIALKQVATGAELQSSASCTSEQNLQTLASVLAIQSAPDATAGTAITASSAELQPAPHRTTEQASEDGITSAELHAEAHGGPAHAAQAPSSTAETASAAEVERSAIGGLICSAAAAVDQLSTQSSTSMQPDMPSDASPGTASDTLVLFGSSCTAGRQGMSNSERVIEHNGKCTDEIQSTSSSVAAALDQPMAAISTRDSACSLLSACNYLHAISSNATADLDSDAEAVASCTAVQLCLLTEQPDPGVNTQDINSEELMSLHLSQADISISRHDSAAAAEAAGCAREGGRKLDSSLAFSFHFRRQASSKKHILASTPDLINRHPL